MLKVPLGARTPIGMEQLHDVPVKAVAGLQYVLVAAVLSLPGFLSTIIIWRKDHDIL